MKSINKSIEKIIKMIKESQNQDMLLIILKQMEDENFTIELLQLVSLVCEYLGEEEYDDDDYFYYDDEDTEDGFPDTIIGEGGLTMYHVGDGVYCDDDGDNWDFF